MENVEGVEAEETTATDSVENQPSEPTEPEVTEQGEPEEVENAEEGLSDEEAAKLLDDPKVKELIEKQVEEKTARQKAANRQLNKKIQDAQKKLQELKEQKQPEKPELSDFDTDADYEKALEDYNDERVTRKAQEALLVQEAQAAANEQYQQSRENFQELETAFKAENPDYEANTQVVQEYIEMIPKDDAGFQEFGKYMAFECENAPALLNHLGANPEKIEALLGKPPALIKRKLEGYMKEVSAPQKEIPQPLPKPPAKAKGSAKPKRTLDDAESVLGALGLK